MRFIPLMIVVSWMGSPAHADGVEPDPPTTAAQWIDTAERTAAALVIPAAVSEDATYDLMWIRSDIAYTRALTGDKDRALAAARSLAAEARRLEDEYYRSDIVQQAVAIMARLGATNEARPLIDDLLAEYRPSALAYIAAADYRAGNLDAYRAGMARARDAVEKLPDDADPWSASDLAWIQMDNGDLKGAAESIPSIKRAVDRVSVRCYLAFEHHRRGQTDKAKKEMAEAGRLFDKTVADPETDPEEIAMTRVAVVWAWAAIGEADRARAELAKMAGADPTFRADAMASLARGEAETDKASAIKRLDEALALTLKPDLPENRSYYADGVWQVAYHAAHAGQLAWVQAKLPTIADPMMKTNFAAGVAFALAERDLWAKQKADRKP